MKEPEGGIVSAVSPESLAERAGIVPGDTIVSIDGHVLRDAVDYQFYAAEPEITAHFRKIDGRDDLVVFEKDPDEDLGLSFGQATWDGVNICNNNCFFCFLKGLPKGLRKPLYLKDDDYRLSFLHGNFVTLTNLDEDDWKRLAEQRLSPLNISVHATDLNLRRHLLGNPQAPDIVTQLERLKNLGLRVHTQIVLTPGVNDGDFLKQSLSDLTSLYPTVETISVVPVGASPRLESWSKERDGIELIPPERDFCRSLIKLVSSFQRRCEETHGQSVVQCADEYYLVAGRRVPSARKYDGFPQYENGIGMVRTLLEDWYKLRRRLRSKPTTAYSGKTIAIACGTLIGPVLSRILTEFTAETGIHASLHPIKNTLFGNRVNVSGLLGGADFVSALQGTAADLVLLPRTSLDYFGEHFLDSMSIAEVEALIGAPLAFATSLSEVFEALEIGPIAPKPASATNGAFWSQSLMEVPNEGIWKQE